MDENSWIPLFSSEFSPENANAMDWGSCGIAAYATGSSIHFCFIENNTIKRLYSTSFRAKYITAIKFHQYTRRLAIGDDNSRIILWDVDLKAGFGSSVVYPNQDVSCLDIKWIKSTAIVLFSNNHFVGLSHSPNKQSDFYVNMTLQWDINLQSPYTRFSIRIGRHINFLLSTQNSLFTVYSTDSQMKAPTQKYDSLEISKTTHINDAQWSIHFRHFAYIALDNEISLFHIKTQNIIPIIHSRGAAQQIVQFIQDPEDHTSLLVLMKNGVINKYKCGDDMKFSLDQEIKTRYASNSIIRLFSAYLIPGKLLAFLDGIGFSLLDTKKLSITSVLPTFPGNCSSVDSFNSVYAIGHSSGFVVVGAFNGDWTLRFSVSKDPVDFVHVCGNDKIFWSTKFSVGSIDIKKRIVSEFKSRVKDVRKVKASRNGALIVQREREALGVFIQEREVPLIFNSPVLDFTLTEESDASNGMISVMLYGNDIISHPYDTNGVKPITGKFRINNDAIPRSLAVSGNSMCISFDNGSVIFFTIGNPNSTRMATTMKSINHVEFAHQSNLVFGIGDKNQLFIMDTRVHICPIPIISASITSFDTAFVLGVDGVPRLLKLKDWQQLYRVSTAFSPPSVDSVSSMKITNYAIEYLRPESFELRNILKESPPLSMVEKYCCGDCSRVFKVKEELFEKMKMSEKIERNKFEIALFSDNFDRATSCLLSCGPNHPDFMKNAALSGCLASMNSTEQSESFKAHLKSVALTMFLANKFDEGAIFMRIIRQDSAAANYLIECGQYTLAKRFIYLLSGEEKSAAISKLAFAHYKNGERRNALYYFAAANEFHAVLCIAQELNMVVDSYFIKKYASEKKLLYPSTNNTLKPLTSQIDFEALCSKIDNDFMNVCQKFGIN